jgi:hypothetical protein
MVDCFCIIEARERIATLERDLAAERAAHRAESQRHADTLKSLGAIERENMDLQWRAARAPRVMPEPLATWVAGMRARHKDIPRILHDNFFRSADCDGDDRALIHAVAESIEWCNAQPAPATDGEGSDPDYAAPAQPDIITEAARRAAAGFAETMQASATLLREYAEGAGR